MTYRVRNIAVAVGLALVAALLTTFYVANYKRHVRQSESTTTVYVAKKDVPAGTPGADLLKRGWIGPQDVVQRSVVPGAISDPDQVRALLTTQDIYAGEQVTLRRFANHEEQGVRSQLHGPIRAVSIPGTPDALLTGTLKDGDHVDLIANLKNPNGQFVATSSATCSCCTRAPNRRRRRSRTAAPRRTPSSLPSATTGKRRRSGSPSRTQAAGR
jgi:pilus assembly protein CpaB